MSTGKVVGLVLGIVGGVILILCIIGGVVACNLINATKDIANNIFDKAGSIVSDVENSTMPEWLKYMIESEDNSIPSEPDDDSIGLLDDASHCYYKETEGGVKITGYDNQFENWQDTYTDTIRPMRRLNNSLTILNTPTVRLDISSFAFSRRSVRSHF